MGIKKFRPTTPSRRHMTVMTFEEITKTEPEKSLTVPLKSTGGRNAKGRLTVRHRGGGHKRLYRIIDFKRNKDQVRLKWRPSNMTSTVRPISLYTLPGWAQSLHHSTAGSEGGGRGRVGSGSDIKVGNALKGYTGRLLIQILSQARQRRSWFVRQVRWPSSWQRGVLRPCAPLRQVRLIHVNRRATIGQIGNLEHENMTLGKAGRSRWLGIRPTVRGSVMNPADHPHGGGEGRAPIGRKYPVSPWGKIAIGGKTRKKKPSDKMIVKKRK